MMTSNQSARALILTTLLIVTTVGDTALAEEDVTSFVPDWRVQGRLQLDAASFDGGNPMLQDKAAIRRGRLALSGRFAANWRLKLEYELTGSTPGPKSIWLRHSLGKRSALTIGHFKESLGLQNATSSRYSTFMERSLPHIFSPGYRLGARFSTSGKFWSTAFGVTGGKLSDSHNHETDGVGVFFRGVLNPARNKNRLWHFGLSTESRRYGVEHSIRLRVRPESDLSDERFLDSGRLRDLDKSMRYAIEFAWRHKSVNVQGELVGASIQRLFEPEVRFSGWYGQFSWFITGESRKYNRDRGSFGRVKPASKRGAWEIAVRRSELDLIDANVFGGDESNTSIALNWYVSRNVRVSMNYIDGSARPDATGANQDIAILQGRFQYVF